jgi:hypothetical protein
MAPTRRTPVSPLTPRTPLVLEVPRYQQPDDVTCGPTCLAQVMRYYGEPLELPEVVVSVRMNAPEVGGTLAVYLGIAAVERGYRAALYPLGFNIFDPTWADLAPPALAAKVRARAAATADPRRVVETRAWAEFLERGGRVEFADLSVDLLRNILHRGRPIISGLSATALYRRVRECPTDNRDDDVHGEPVGHFVVVCGHSPQTRRFAVCDPSPHAPFSRTGRYSVEARRLLNAILLGDATRDAVLLEVWPARRERHP